MDDSVQIGFCNQKGINKQLPPYIYRDYFRLLFKIGYWHILCFLRLCIAGWPLFGQVYAIVKYFCLGNSYARYYQTEQ